MLIKVISDTHNRHDLLELGSGDVLVHCGDATNSGKYEETLTFLRWFNRQNFKYKIFVPGNHDRTIKKDEISSHKLRGYCLETGIIYLNHQHAHIEGILFYGGTHTPYFRGGVNMSEQERLANGMPDPYANLSPNTQILITHCPPKGILDKNDVDESIGCNLLLEAVKRVKPHIHLFGHVHESNGEKLTVGKTKFYNCCNLNLYHDVMRNYTEVHYE